MKMTIEGNPGLAAKTHVRLPNMHEFWSHLWLPKVAWPATYKRPHGRKWASFLPHFRPEVSPCPPMVGFDVLPQIFQVLTSGCLVFEVFEAKIKFWSLETQGARFLPSPS